MKILLSRLAVDPENARRIKPSPDADAALRASMAAIGQLQPILVRGNPLEDTPLLVVAGARRFAAAQALGWTEIEAHSVETAQTGAEAYAASAAENMVRAGMDPLDQWAAVRALQASGYTLDGAAQCLGLSRRRANQLDRLGGLHHELLLEIRGTGMPEDRYLNIIAAAPVEVQANAIKLVRQQNNGQTNWWRIAQHCTLKRIPMNRAIFETGPGGPVIFEQDFFAEPDSEDEWTTHDVAGFIRAQTAALAARVIAAKKKKQRITVCEVGEDGRMVLPPGWKMIMRLDAASKLPRPKERNGELRMVFTGVIEDGFWIGQVIEALAEPLAARLPAAARNGAAGAAEPETVKPAREPITKAGQMAVARAKTEALRARLQDAAPVMEDGELLRLLLLALGALNVTIRECGPDFPDLRGLVDAAGAARAIEPAALKDAAARAIGAMLIVGGPNSFAASGDVAEWIGAMIGAERALPRFDTAEFLENVSGETLRKLAATCGLADVSKVSDLRKRLAGRLPEWRPCAFGAAGPGVETEEYGARWADGEAEGEDELVDASDLPEFGAEAAQ